ncbi:hypothetical protein [Gillisia sp. JM1]|uniref:hypothetical protein n=1 Tax=Gillisia sp. JM1 TaxID=1283286 RepID=UPI00047C812E|nr:hypothetical protein [Gillisia sp. JM1]
MTAEVKLIKSKIVFILSFLTSAFWCLVQFIDVYHFAVVGAVFEILWLPMIIALFILPILTLIFWGIDKFNLKSFNFYSFIITMATGALADFKKLVLIFKLF